MIFQKTETVTGTYIPELNDALCTGANLIDAIPKSETLSLYFAGEKEGTADLLRISAILDSDNKPSLSVEFVPGEWVEANTGSNAESDDE